MKNYFLGTLTLFMVIVTGITIGALDNSPFAFWFVQTPSLILLSFIVCDWHHHHYGNTLVDAIKEAEERPVTDWRALKLQCDMCHIDRAWDDIAVLTYPLKDLPHGERNLRYCKDNEICRRDALAKSQTGMV